MVKYGKNSLIYECIKIWNVLDTRIKSCSNLKEFKQMISLWNGYLNVTVVFAKFVKLASYRFYLCVCKNNII